MATAHSKDWPRDVHTMTWYCDLGHKEPVEFDNEMEWREHVRTLSLHPGRLKPPSDAQLDTLAVRKQQLSPREPYVCPFCEDKPRSIAVLGDRGNPTDMANMLVTHIAEHVKSLSFLALPGLDDEATEEKATEEEANKRKGWSVNFENSDKRLRNPGSPPQPPSGVTYVEDISLTFEDNDDEPESQAHKKPPPVVYIDPVYVTNQSAHDMNNTAETKVDRFFISIPADEPDFSWGFIMPHDVPLSAVDSAFQKWPNQRQNTDREELYQRLRDVRIRCCEQKFTFFIPLNKQKELITASAIEDEIRKKDVERKCQDPRECARWAHQYAKQLFTILSYMGKGGDWIYQMYRDGISDNDLPLEAVEKLTRVVELRRKSDKKVIPAFGAWENDDREDFVRFQWWVLVPEFDKRDLRCREFLDEIVLPLMDAKDEGASDEVVPQMKVGGFSTVTAYRIHSAHHNFWSLPSVSEVRMMN
jgi:hypothetical protein